MRVFVVLGTIFFTLNVFAATEGAKTTKVSPSCVKLSAGCSICTDGQKRTPGNDRGKPLSDSVTDFDCAVGIKAKSAKKAETKECKKISDYCSVCPDGSFEFNEGKKKIISDLYACATSPRVEKSEAGKKF